MSATVVDRQRPVIRAVAGRVGLLGGLSIALLVSLVFAAGHGQLDVPPSEVLGSLMHKIGLDIGSMPSHPQGENTLWQVRFPRVVMAALAGACLATAGALMQGVFGNPLAEPSVVGVSAGAAVGAAAAS
jgi:iron complex transport system permease protein